MEASDGAPITYYTAGEGRPFIIANGLGGSNKSLIPIINAFPEGWRFITWDYRGLYDSVPVDDDHDLSIDRHVQDMEEIMQIEKIKSAVFLGWSMGVQVVLDFAGNYPNRADAVIALNGTYGEPFTGAFNLPYTERIIPYIFKGMKKIGPRIQVPMRYISRLNRIGQFARMVGIVRKNADVELMNAIIRDYTSSINLDTYAEIFLELGRHNAWDVLEYIKAPVLIIAGTKDLLTPISTAYKMMEEIPDVELFKIDKASHFCLLEVPDMVNEKIAEFLEENVKPLRKPAKRRAAKKAPAKKKTTKGRGKKK